MTGEQLGRVRVAGGQADEQVLGGDVLVVHLGRQVGGRGDRSDRLGCQLRLRARAGCTGQPVEKSLRLGADCRRFDADGLQKRCGNAIVLSEQCHQQMGGRDLRVARGGSRLQRRSQGRLGFGRRIERVHDTSLSVYRGPHKGPLKCLSCCSTPSRLSLFRSTLTIFGNTRRRVPISRSTGLTLDRCGIWSSPSRLPGCPS